MIDGGARSLSCHDNWAPHDSQSDRRLHRLFDTALVSAPGYDDAGRRPLAERNITTRRSPPHRTALRRRGWNDLPHERWGATDETVAGSALDGFLCELHDEHGLYYANASTWEHAAPDPHWRQPYWNITTCSPISWRSSYLVSQGTHAVGAVHYPVARPTAGAPGRRPITPPHGPFARGVRRRSTMTSSMTIYSATTIETPVDRRWNGYRALVFGP